MKVKTYRAETLQEAFAKAQAELGEDAVLLHQREVPTPSSRGRPQRSLVEITVAADVAPASSRQAITPIPADAAENVRPYFASSATKPTPPPRPKPTAAPAPSTSQPVGNPLDALKGDYESLRREVAYIRRLLQRQHNLQDNLPDVLVAWREALFDCQLPSDLVEDLIADIHEVLTPQALARPEMVSAAVVQRLVTQLPAVQGPLQPGKPGDPLIFVLVGPTGVGKTTTIAKLAAQYSIHKRVPIALITADTFRIGAVGQLRTYSDLIRAPLEVAYTPEDLTAQVAKHQDKALILVDTPGRSPTDTEQLEVLRSFVSVLEQPHVELALAAGTPLPDALRIVDRFAVAPLSSIVLTKVDETTIFGPACALLAARQLPLSYVTTGQRVPEDIQVGNNQELVGWLVQRARRQLADKNVAKGGPYLAAALQQPAQSGRLYTNV